jgi:hypothetical protein
MANTNPVTNVYKVGRGQLHFALLLSDGTYDGFRPMGNTPGFDITVESEELTHTSSMGGLGEVDLQVPISITRAATITVDNLDDDNLGIIFAAAVSDVSQTSTSVTNEAINKIRPYRGYPLGGTLVGVRNISAVSVDVNATARANSTAYIVGQIYAPATPNNHIYICTVAGTSASSPPSFTTDGTTFTDGTATFKDLGAINGLTSGTDFLVDADVGWVSIPTTGKLATAYANALAAVSDTSLWSINLHVDYTRPAATFRQIATGALAAVRGQLRWNADNPVGKNQDVLIPDATLRPNGAVSQVTADEVASVELAVGISKLDSATPALYYFGRVIA